MIRERHIRRSGRKKTGHYCKQEGVFHEKSDILLIAVDPDIKAELKTLLQITYR